MIVDYVSSYPVSPSRDVYFTLGTPLASVVTKKKSSLIWSLVDFKSSADNEEKFYQLFSSRIQDIFSLLKKMDTSENSNAFLQGFFSYLLSNKISICLSDFLQYAAKYQLNLESMQKIYVLAQNLKRHESSRNVLWNALPKAQQVFLHQFFLWSEDLRVLKEPITYQWLGDGRVERIEQTGPIATDFGDGQLFNVEPASSLGEHSEFPLTRYPDCQIVKASPDQKQLSQVNLITSMMTLNHAAIGRVAEIFDVQALEVEIKKGEEKSTLSINQFLDVFTCYRSALCSVLDLPVHLPFAIGRQGEWAIWKNKKEPWKEQSLSSSMVQDLHRLMQMERVWRINVFNDASSSFTPLFAISDDHLCVDGILPLPTFLSSNIQERHQSLFKKLKLDVESLEQLGKLEEATEKEEKKISYLIYCLKGLIERKSLTFQDLTTLEPQVLLLVRLMRLIDRTTSLQFPLSAQSFLDTTGQMLEGLIPKEFSVPYTFQKTLEHKGEHLTDVLLNSKKELTFLMMLYVIEKFEKKDSTEELIQSLLDIIQEKCQQIAEGLHSTLSPTWPFKESIEEHLMLLFGDELLEECNQILRQPCDDHTHLYDKLFLLRVALEYPKAEIKNLNHGLQSILHDAMVQKYSQAFLVDMQQHIGKLNL